MTPKAPKTALVHDWLTGMRGGEKVLEAVGSLFPEAELFTLFHDPRRISASLNARRIHVSRLQSLPAVLSYYRYLLPLMPWAVQSFDLSGFDLIVSSSHCVAKGAGYWPAGSRRPLHICYCHTPMRYVYYQFDNYFAGGVRGRLKSLANWFRPSLKRWDQRTATQVDHFIANSENVRRRIQTTYGRDAEVIYPPVDTDFFRPAETPAGGGYYLVAGALVPYKRVDIAIEACARLDVPLKIVGIGNDEKRLMKLARGANVEFLGWRQGEELRELYRGCRALLFPQEEDFGITAVEAMACGKPVIAFGRGGALETVVDGRTGVFFPEQTAESMAQAIERAEGLSFDPAAIRAQAERFDRKAFLERFSETVERLVSGRFTAAPVNL